MNKEFVTYEQALALEELGFDEPCIKAFYEKEPIYTVVATPVDFNNKKQLGELISGPLYQQAFRWFRDKHGLKSWVEEYNKVKFIYQIRPHKITDYKKGEVYVYKIYEEAELACLDKLIEIVKNK